MTSFQLDGIGLPLNFGLQTGNVDTAVYDRVEVIRGANGLLSPTDNPSATINFVRKRSTADFRAGDIFLQAQFPLHSGRILGLPGRVLVSPLGLAVATLSVTGLVIWIRRRAARAGRNAESLTVAPAVRRGTWIVEENR